MEFKKERDLLDAFNSNSLTIIKRVIEYYKIHDYDVLRLALTVDVETLAMKQCITGIISNCMISADYLSSVFLYQVNDLTARFNYRYPDYELPHSATNLHRLYSIVINGGIHDLLDLRVYIENYLQKTPVQRDKTERYTYFDHWGAFCDGIRDKDFANIRTSKHISNTRHKLVLNNNVDSYTTFHIRGLKSTRIKFISMYLRNLYLQDGFLRPVRTQEQRVLLLFACQTGDLTLLRKCMLEEHTQDVFIKLYQMAACNHHEDIIRYLDIEFKKQYPDIRTQQEVIFKVCRNINHDGEANYTLRQSSIYEKEFDVVLRISATSYLLNRGLNIKNKYVKELTFYGKYREQFITNAINDIMYKECSMHDANTTQIMLSYVGVYSAPCINDTPMMTAYTAEISDELQQYEADKRPLYIKFPDSKDLPNSLVQKSVLHSAKTCKEYKYNAFE